MSVFIDVLKYMRRLYREFRLASAKRALLKIVEIDKTNDAAFNRLGILYARKGDLSESIDNFKRAHRIKPSASTYHNLGLIYYESKDYTKSAEMLKKAMALESSLAIRYIAYAKVLEKLNKKDEMVHYLELAFEIEPTEQYYKILYDAYLRTGRQVKAKRLKKLHELHSSKDSESVSSLIDATRQLLDSTRSFNQELDQIAIKHGL